MDISKFENITKPDFSYRFPSEVSPCTTQPFEGGILHTKVEKMGEAGHNIPSIIHHTKDPVFAMKLEASQLKLLSCGRTPLQTLLRY